MIPTLSKEQLLALSRHPGKPIEVRDPETQARYVIMPFDAYERIRNDFDYDDSGEVDPREVSLLVDQVMAEDDADDPSLQSYQNITRDGNSV